ncbi:MAG: ATP-dependent zinc protease [Gammaproteobacteria bacterium]|nr:MAG: ATP-dependent zinc protease [Gammaproteobacteria bacterium]
MNSSIKSLFFAAVMLPIPAWLAACGTVAPDEKVEDRRMEQLLVGMDRCLTNQTLVNEQLRSQERQLDQQKLQLDVMTEGLAAPVDDIPPADACAGLTETYSKQVVGQWELVWLPNLQLALPARIDTGAETASLDARNIELFERDGRRWVRFEILHPDTGEPLLMERKLKRMVVIIQSNTAESERRPVIKLGVTIGSISQTAEFTLSNRNHLDYQLLIGRNILQDVMVVDVSKKNIAPYVTAQSSAGSGEIAP